MKSAEFRRVEAGGDLRRKTELDEGLQQLKHITKIGWPETKEEVPSEIRRYFDFKEELSI